MSVKIINSMSCNTATVALGAAAVLRWWLVHTISIMRTLSFSASSSTLLPARNTGTSVWQTLHHPRHLTDKGYCKSCILGLTGVQWINEYGVSASFSSIQPTIMISCLMKGWSGSVLVSNIKLSQSEGRMKGVRDANNRHSLFADHEECLH